jgi:regulator of replication initiation timing
MRLYPFLLLIAFHANFCGANNIFSLFKSLFRRSSSSIETNSINHDIESLDDLRASNAMLVTKVSSLKLALGQYKKLNDELKKSHRGAEGRFIAEKDVIKSAHNAEIDKLKHEFARDNELLVTNLKSSFELETSKLKDDISKLHSKEINELKNQLSKAADENASLKVTETLLKNEIADIKSKFEAEEMKNRNSMKVRVSPNYISVTIECC